jgi:dipeptidyl aminopeptidase/acylaminoacyl peptidase
MFGPYDLFTFMERIPETWKPYFALFLGDAEKDRDFLVDRSPKTHVGNIQCPLFVIQGQNDPRVVEQESHDLVDELRAMGKDVDYLVFPDEGPRRAEAPEPRALLRRDHVVLLRASERGVGLSAC